MFRVYNEYIKVFFCLNKLHKLTIRNSNYVIFHITIYMYKLCRMHYSTLDFETKYNWRIFFWNYFRFLTKKFQQPRALIRRESKMKALGLIARLRIQNQFKIQRLSYAAEANTFQAFTNLKTSYSNSISNFPLVTKTIRDLIDENVHNNRKIYCFPHQGIDLSASELNERVGVAAQNLLKLGFRKGDRIGIVLANTLEMVISTLACAYIGGISVLLNPAYQLVELEYMLKKAGTKGLIIYDSFKHLQHLNIIRKICPELDSCAPGELNSKRLPDLRHVFVLNSPLSPEKKDYKGTWKYDLLSEKASTSLRHELSYLELDDPSLILFTSGTTGKPKGALLNQSGLLNSCYLSVKCAGEQLENTFVCNPIPFFHIYGFATGILEPLLTEDARVFPFFFPETLTTIKALEKYKCNSLRGTPTQFIDLINNPARSKHDLTHLKRAIIAGSTVPPDLLTKMKEALKVDDVFVGYGRLSSIK